MIDWKAPLQLKNPKSRANWKIIKIEELDNIACTMYLVTVQALWGHRSIRKYVLEENGCAPGRVNPFVENIPDDYRNLY